MPIPDYRCFQHSNELYHYGMPHRSGRYPWGSGDRPYQSREDKKIRDVENRLEKRFNKLDKTIEKNQSLANKKYAKAIKKSTRRFQTELSISSAKRNFIKATRAQQKVNKAIYKGSKYFQKYEKLIDELNVDMNDDLKRRGTEYVNKAIFNPDSAFQVSLTKKI